MTNIAEELSDLVDDIIALGTDHTNGAFPDGRKPDGTYAVQNEAEAIEAIKSLFAATLSQLEGELPEKRGDGGLRDDKKARTIALREGFNDCLDIVHAKIKEIREGLNNG